MGVILEKRYTDVEPYYYEPWWDRASEGTRIGIYVAGIALILVSHPIPSHHSSSLHLTRP